MHNDHAVAHPHKYSFRKEGDRWIVHSEFGCQDYVVTKENMKEVFYDLFAQILPDNSQDGLERARAKLPAYIQFDGQVLPTDAGEVDTTIELYVRRHQIEQASIIMHGTNGTTAKVPVEKFHLYLEHVELEHGALDDDDAVVE